MIKHLACMMDGNRRWAISQGLQPWLGHKQGVESLKKLIKFCLEKKIPYASVYTFSLENFKRPEQEKQFVFNLMAQELGKVADELIERGVRICFIGDRTLFPASVVETCEAVERKTEHVSTLTLNLLFCYGSQQEIVFGVKSIIRKIKSGLLKEEDIDKETISQHLWTRGTPEPELVIRTGGARRLSNFLLYQSAYSEFYFLDCMWPELTQEHLEQTLEDFANRKRNFGA